MPYNQAFQTAIDGIKNITRTDLCIMDTEGNVIASTMSDAASFKESVCTFIDSQAEIQVVSGYQYFKIMDAGSLECVLLIRGDSDDIYTIGKLAAFQIQTMLATHKEKYDKDNFIKNVILNNMLPVDIRNRAQKLHIDTQKRRIVFVIETSTTTDNSAMEIIKGLFAGKSGEYIVAIKEGRIVLVKELADTDSYNQMYALGKTMVDLLNTEAMTKVLIGYGTIVNNIKDISKSYGEAKLALNVGRVFYEEKKVIGYNRLGIGRLIYQLPMSLCKMFIDEVFPEISPDEFDDETLMTIQKFFENSLNVSETARQLYIHRNTLVYRLEKVNKATGLDLRVFDDAIIFEIALMVVRHMRYMEGKDF